MISRRQFLVGTAVVMSAAGTAAYIARPHLRRLIQPTLDTTYPLGLLNNKEALTIATLGLVLASPRSVPPLGFFREYVDFVTQSLPGFLREYQRSAALLDEISVHVIPQKSEGSFAHLTRNECDEVLGVLLWRYSGQDYIRPKLEKLFAGRDALALRTYVMQPMIEYYYRSLYGWAVVGYESFPGHPPPDPRAYTRPPGVTATAA
jgi:hypothetical protein